MRAVAVLSTIMGVLLAVAGCGGSQRVADHVTPEATAPAPTAPRTPGGDAAPFQGGAVALERCDWYEADQEVGDLAPEERSWWLACDWAVVVTGDDPVLVRTQDWEAVNAYDGRLYEPTVETTGTSGVDTLLPPGQRVTGRVAFNVDPGQNVSVRWSAPQEPPLVGQWLVDWPHA